MCIPPDNVETRPAKVLLENRPKSKTRKVHKINLRALQINIRIFKVKKKLMWCSLGALRRGPRLSEVRLRACRVLAALAIGSVLLVTCRRAPRQRVEAPSAARRAPAG
jgi:hypothetical protein